MAELAQAIASRKKEKPLNAVVGWVKKNPGMVGVAIPSLWVLYLVDSTVHEFGHWILLKYLELPTQGFVPGMCPVPQDCPKMVFIAVPIASMIWGGALLATGAVLWNKKVQKVITGLIFYTGAVSFFIVGLANLVPDSNRPEKDGSKYFLSKPQAVPYLATRRFTA